MPFRDAVRLVTPFALLAALAACSRISTIERNPAAGFNGDFEVVQAELPANWYVYQPPIDSGAADIALDTQDAVQGTRSLRFTVHRVDSMPRHGPGMFQEVPATPGTTYRVSFWLKNRDTTATIQLRATQPKQSPPPQITRLGPEETGTDEWRRFELDYAVPAGHDRLRFELNVLAPGTLWIDDVRIEERP